MMRRLSTSVAVSFAVLSLGAVYGACSKSPTGPSSAAPTLPSILGGFVEEGYESDKCDRPDKPKLNELVKIVPQGPVDLKSTRTGSNVKPGDKTLGFQLGEGSPCKGKCANEQCRPIIKSGKWTLLPADQKVAKIVGPDDQVNVTVEAARDVAAPANITLHLKLVLTCAPRCPTCGGPSRPECESDSVDFERATPITVNPAKGR